MTPPAPVATPPAPIGTPPLPVVDPPAEDPPPDPTSAPPIDGTPLCPPLPPDGPFSSALLPEQAREPTRGTRIDRDQCQLARGAIDSPRVRCSKEAPILRRNPSFVPNSIGIRASGRGGAWIQGPMGDRCKQPCNDPGTGSDAARCAQCSAVTVRGVAVTARKRESEQAPADRPTLRPKRKSHDLHRISPSRKRPDLTGFYDAAPRNSSRKRLR